MMSKRIFINAFTTACWFIFLTFPLMVIKVDPIENSVEYRWLNGLLVGITVFLGYLLVQTIGASRDKDAAGLKTITLLSSHSPKAISLFRASRKQLLGTCLVFTLLFPHIFSSYQTTIMINALIYIVLGLGLNIVVGLAGLLDLGYVAFYAVGAYAYGLLNLRYGLGFWAVLPIGALCGAFFGILLGFPVLRLRGDYLAIVTLGFGEIIRLILENWGEFTHGPSGISNIPRPDFFGLEEYVDPTICLYYLMIVLGLFTIFIVNRLQNSRIGRAWLALREDEIACQAMGIDKTRTKLTAFALGATWAGMMGVVFAAKTRYINPACFTFWESAIILCIVVLGGMGSIIGVIIAALLLVLLPEHFRAFSEYRLLVFGAALVLMMRFRPGGIIGTVRRTYSFSGQKAGRSHD